MKNSSRQAQILQLLQNNTSMEVEVLASYFGVTPTTIRRDLTSLEKQHMITRSHGRAHINSQLYLSDFGIRKNIQAKEKKLIALEALRHISPLESIILDSGTTTLAIAEALANRPIPDVTVLTPSLPIADTLAKDFQVMLPGGVLHSPSMSLIGPTAESYFETVRADKFFISSTGVLDTVGLSAVSPYHVALKQKILKATNKIIAVIDSSKYSISGVNLVCEFEEIDMLITSKTKQNDAELDVISRKGVEVVLVGE